MLITSLHLVFVSGMTQMTHETEDSTEVLDPTTSLTPSTTTSPTTAATPLTFLVSPRVCGQETTRSPT